MTTRDILFLKLLESGLLALGACVLLIVGAQRAAVQQTAARLQGTVTDASGAVIPGTAVATRDESTGARSSGTTDENGSYEIGALAPGRYTISAEVPGFTPRTRRAVELTTGRPTRTDFRLQLEAVDTVVVVRTRAEPRSTTRSSVPIDVIGDADIRGQGDTSLDYTLRTVVPSFNVNSQTIGDEATLSRPANLRGLAPDHTLVLVTGKRRHRSGALKWWTSGVNRGGQGPDLSAIPAIALRQVEILRDGASAEYGSDAIAGVLNFVLKDDRSGGSAEFRSGVTSGGDGSGPHCRQQCQHPAWRGRLREPQHRVRELWPDEP